ncbi:MAG: hypothetical protein ABGX43_01115, partial [Nitrospinaceae bacterium]
MFVYDSMTQGLELLAMRELQEAENLFLNVINDPLTLPEVTKQAKQYLSDIRDCKRGDRTLDFDIYKSLVKKVDVSLDYLDEIISDTYFSHARSYAEIDEKLSSKISSIVSRLKQIKIRDVSARDKLFARLESSSAQLVKKRLKQQKDNAEE